MSSVQAIPDNYPPLAMPGSRIAARRNISACWLLPLSRPVPSYGVHTVADELMLLR